MCRKAAVASPKGRARQGKVQHSGALPVRFKNLYGWAVALKQIGGYADVSKASKRTESQLD